MGAEGSREEKKLEGLPLVRKKFRMVSVLGAGNFGGVYKVQHKKTKKFYALKCVPIDSLKKGTSEAQQKQVYQTALTEKKLLKNLKHDSVVRLYDSFVLNYSPVEKNQRGKKRRCRHFCLLLEYCHGSTLDSVLKKLETRKKEEEKFKDPRARRDPNSEEDKPLIPKDLAIIWFIKLLETMVYIHSKKVIHRDLKPDNVLLCYKSLDDYKNIQVKLSDFGAAKDVSETLGNDLSGQIFYAAPEVVQQSGAYDSRADMWSLGIIFLQVYAQISIDTYLKHVHKIFNKIKTTPALRQKFCDRYRIKDLKNVAWITLINFMHERELFFTMIEDYIDDAGVRHVLNSMMCPYEKRLFAKDLLKLPCIQTWRYIMDREGKTKVEEFDLLGLITIMKMPDNILFTRCLQVLKDRVLDNVERFVDNGGIKVMLERLWRLREMWKRRYLKDMVHILMKILCEMRLSSEKAFEKSMREIVIYFRQFGCLQTLEKLLMFQNNATIYYFTFMIARYSQTIRCKLCNQQTIRNLVMKMNRRNEIYIKAILDTLVPYMEADQLDQLIRLYKKNDLTFFKRCRHRELVFNKVLNRLFLHLRDIVDRGSGQGLAQDNNNKKKKKKKSKKKIMDMDDEEEESQEEIEIIEVLSNIIFQVQEFDLSLHVHRQKLHFLYDEIPADTRMELSRTNVDDWKLVDIQPLHISCMTQDKKMIEMLSQTPLLNFKKIAPEHEEEVCISYFEIIIENGGFTDDLYFGYRCLKVRPSQVLLHAATGTVGVVDFSKKQVKQKKIPPIYCETRSVIGCGLTNKGRVFYTKDNRVHKPFIQFFPTRYATYSEAVPVRVSIKFNGNFEFKGILNFGRMPFNYKFKEVKPKIDPPKRKRRGRRSKKNEVTEPRGVNKLALNCMKYEDPGNFIMQKVKLQFESNEFIMALTEKISSLLKFNKDHDIDDELQDLYNEDEFAKVDLAFENSGEFKQSFVGKGTKKFISSRFSELQKEINERKDEGGYEEEEEQQQQPSIIDLNNKKKKGAPANRNIMKLAAMGKRNSVAAFFEKDKRQSVMQMFDESLFQQRMEE